MSQVCASSRSTASTTTTWGAQCDSIGHKQTSTWLSRSVLILDVLSILLQYIVIIPHFGYTAKNLHVHVVCPCRSLQLWQSVAWVHLLAVKIVINTTRYETWVEELIECPEWTLYFMQDDFLSAICDCCLNKIINNNHRDVPAVLQILWSGILNPYMSIWSIWRGFYVHAYLAATDVCRFMRNRKW